MSHFKRRKPRTQVRCVMCTPRGDAKETARRRRRAAARAGAVNTENEPGK